MFEFRFFIEKNIEKWYLSKGNIIFEKMFFVFFRWMGMCLICFFDLFIRVVK